MKLRLLSGLGALLLLTGFVAATGAQAQRQSATVALFPARVFNGDPENGEVVTNALRNRLENAGMDVISEREVRRALRQEALPLSRPISVQALAELRRDLGVTYLVYPRVLSVGWGVNSEDPQATILVNVVGRPSNAFVHTRQVGQMFQGDGSGPQLINRRAAAEAAGKLLAGFLRQRK